MPVVLARAAERLAGARGKFFFRGPYLVFFSGKFFFLRTSFPHHPPPSTSQLLSRDFISIFHAKFRYLAQKTDILSFARKYLTHKKDWGPTKNFQGLPAPRGPGQFASLPPPPLGGPGTSQDGVLDDESLVKTRTNTCLSYTSAVPSYSVPE